ncbi:MAG: hypothetical protein KDB37_08135, partial [Ilumatobacter sp.]|nr:hypothetical protein [Ilumatobacter sp.]
LLVGVLGVAVGCAVMALRPTIVVVLLGAAAVKSVVPLVSSIVATVYHERVPPSMQGRIFGLRSAATRSLDPIGAAVAGVVITRLAEPAMDDGGWAAGSVGSVIGVGADRGGALVLLAVSAAMTMLAIWLRRAIGTTLDIAPAVDDDTPRIVVEPVPAGT